VRNTGKYIRREFRKESHSDRLQGRCPNSCEEAKKGVKEMVAVNRKTGVISPPRVLRRREAEQKARKGGGHFGVIGKGEDLQSFGT